MFTSKENAVRRITSSAFSPRQNVSVFSGSMARARCQAKQRKCTCRRRDVIVLSAHRRCPTPQTRRGLSIRHCPDRRAHARTDAPPGLRRNTPASRARVSGVIYGLGGGLYLQPAVVKRGMFYSLCSRSGSETCMMSRFSSPRSACMGASRL